jgi:hypothetical protein
MDCSRVKRRGGFMNINGKIYYDLQTGNVILHLVEQKDVFGISPTTIEQDIATFTALSERNRETFDVIELPLGAYTQDFIGSRGNYRVNVETKKLEFSYPDANEPDARPVYQAPLSLEVVKLKQENNLLKAQTQANADRTDFHEEVLTEIILAINP